MKKMKTSNQLILLTIAVIISVIVATGVFYRLTMKSAQHYTGETIIRGTGQTRTITKTNVPMGRVEIKGPFKVVLKPGDEDTVSVSGDQALLDNIELEQRRGQLSIRPKGKAQVVAGAPMEVELVSSHIGMLSLLGGNIQLDARDLNQDGLLLSLAGDVSGVISGELDQLAVNAGGVANLELNDIHVDQLVLNLSGKTNVTVSGRAKKLTGSALGDAMYNTFQLKAKQVIAMASGNARAFVLAKDEITLVATDDAMIQYKGHPKVLKETIRDRGKVEALDAGR
jgi:hypothetical protein